MHEIEFEHTVHAWTVSDLRRAIGGVPDAVEQIVTGAAASVQRDGPMLTATPEFWLALDYPPGRHSQCGG